MSNLHRRQRGLSLIELMIALLIGTILLLGITSLFNTTSNVNRLENGLARLQENGRFALSRIAEDLRMATATRSMRKASEGGGPGATNPDRPMLSFVNLGAGPYLQHGLPPAPTAAGTSRYLIPPSFLLRGHDCTGTTCTPAIAAVPGADRYDVSGYGALPALGVTVNSRARGGDVLTLRYLRGEGTPLRSDFSGLVEGGTLELRAGSDFQLGSSGLVVVGDYATTAIMAVRRIDGETLQGVGNLPGARVLSAFSPGNDARVNDFDRDFVTVTYYLRLTADPSRPGRLVSTLRRRENGIDVAVAEGIERLDFLYHVEDRLGRMRPLTAAQVQALAPADCAQASLNPPLVAPIAAQDAANCGWRSVRAIEVFLLANTVDDAGSLVEPFQYAFLASGAANAANTLQVACDPAQGTCPGGSITTLPSGLPPGRMLRREFRTVVTLRNNAY